MRLSIEHQCPQCGAPAVLEEAERLFTCDFCRVRSYLLGGRYFRYRFEAKSADDNRDIVYVPYWRFKGMLYITTPEGVEHRIVDVSTLAVSSGHFPISVGLRSQALKLKFVDPKTSGIFIRPTLPFDGMLDQVMVRFEENTKRQIYHSTCIGENLSLIYSPFYLDRKLYDAVLEKPVTAELSVEDLMQGADLERPDWSIRFIPVICPDCGWDLEGERESLTLNCRNCQTGWMSTAKGLLKIKFGVMAGGQQNSLYLPFWRIRASVSGIRLDSCKDLIERANLPKVVRPEMADQPFYFWMPAFKIRPRIFLLLSRTLTTAQPDQEMHGDFPRSGLHPVTLPVTEARESLKIIMAEIIRPAREFRISLPDVTARPERFKLVYIPFEESHHELLQTDYHMTIQKSMLSMAKNL